MLHTFSYFDPHGIIGRTHLLELIGGDQSIPRNSVLNGFLKNSVLNGLMIGSSCNPAGTVAQQHTFRGLRDNKNVDCCLIGLGWAKLSTAGESDFFFLTKATKLQFRGLLSPLISGYQVTQDD